MSSTLFQFGNVTTHSSGVLILNVDVSIVNELICAVVIDGNVIVPPVVYVYDDGDDTYVILLLVSIVLYKPQSIVSIPLMVIVSIVLLDVGE